MHRVFIEPLRNINPWLRKFIFSRVIETLLTLLEQSIRKAEKLNLLSFNFINIVIFLKIRKLLLGKYKKKNKKYLYL